MPTQEALYSTIAPEICVEVMSPGNTWAQMLNKRALYFKAQAEEFWICSETGAMNFFNPTGELASSRLVPEFPKSLELFDE